MAKNGLQELRAALVSISRAEVAGQEPDHSDNHNDHNGDDEEDDADDDADDYDADVVDFVDAKYDPLYDGVDGSWVSKLIKGSLGDDDELDEDGGCGGVRLWGL